MSILARNYYSRNRMISVGNKHNKYRQFGVTTSLATVPVQPITLSTGDSYCGLPSTFTDRPKADH